MYTLETEFEYYRTQWLANEFEQALRDAETEGHVDLPPSLRGAQIGSIRRQLEDFHKQLAEYEARERSPLQKAA